MVSKIAEYAILINTLTLNTLALPNLITPELVITHPMSSISGNITFLNYVAGSNKGGVLGNKERQKATLFNGVYSLGEMTPERMNYTGERVVEFANEVDEESWYQLSWTPVREAQAWNGTEWVECEVTLDGKVQVPAGTKIRYIYDNELIPQNDLPILNAQLEVMPLQAKVRRIAINF